MVERLKRWESPRKRGRNDKGKGGSARSRQLHKREQMLKQKLRKNSSAKRAQQERENNPSLFFSNLAYILINISDNNTEAASKWRSIIKFTYSKL